jgi:hypothetical protein
VNLTAHEESELRALVDAAFDARGTDAMRSRVDEIEAWYRALPGRRLGLRATAGEQFLQEKRAAAAADTDEGGDSRQEGA